MSLNKADTCQIYVTPNLREAGLVNLPHAITEQYTFTGGRVKLTRENIKRDKRKRADYLLLYKRDYAIAIVEAKPEGHTASSGMQQAKNYAEILGLQSS